jgi:hypothetical protein
MKKLLALLISLGILASCKNTTDSGLKEEHINIKDSDISSQNLLNDNTKAPSTTNLVSKRTSFASHKVSHKNRKKNFRKKKRHYNRRKVHKTTLTIVLSPAEKKAILRSARKHKKSVNRYIKDATRAYSK